jgi:hypothetical protein
MVHARADRGWATGVLLAALVAGALVAQAAAAKKEGGSGATIIISGKPVPLKVFQQKSGNVLQKWFQSNRSTELWEKKDIEGWEFWILIMFSKPLNELQFDLSFYDVEVVPKHLVDSFSVMLMKKGEKLIPHKIRLSSKQFKVNHQYMMQLSVKSVKKAEKTFNLRGVAPVHSGEVVFTDAETKGQ